MAKKGQIQKRYSTEFKIGVIIDMREHRLGYRETAYKYMLKYLCELCYNYIDRIAWLPMTGG